jgi:hypothetical protein
LGSEFGLEKMMKKKTKMIFFYRSEEKRICSYLNYRRNEEKFVPKLSKKRRQTKLFVPQPSKERRKTNAFFPQLSKGRRKTNLPCAADFSIAQLAKGKKSRP